MAGGMLQLCDGFSTKSYALPLLLPFLLGHWSYCLSGSGVEVPTASGEQPSARVQGRCTILETSAQQSEDHTGGSVERFRPHLQRRVLLFHCFRFLCLWDSNMDFT